MLAFLFKAGPHNMCHADDRMRVRFNKSLARSGIRGESAYLKSLGNSRVAATRENESPAFSRPHRT